MIASGSVPRTMRTLLRPAVAEGMVILILSTAAGYLYTDLAGNGCFRPPSGGPLAGPMEVVPFTSITLEEAQYLQGHQEVIFIDARSGYDFGLGHIKGAINLPLHDFNEAHPLMHILTRDRELVLYCDGEDCNSSKDLARLLRASGFTHVRIFFGGWNEWRAHDLPEEP